MRARPSLVVLCLVFTAPLAMSVVVSTSDPSKCSLDIRGDPETLKVRKASFHCTGPKVTAAVQGELSRFKDSFSGVEWGSSADCINTAGCLVTVCGASHVVFLNATLNHLKLPRVEASFGRGLCFNGTSRATLLGAQVHYIQGTGIWASGNSVLAVHGSRISNNAEIGIAASRKATVNIENSTVTDNKSDGYSGGGLVAQGNATVTISGGSVLSGNVAVNASGGGLAAFGNATVNIENSTVTDNKSDGYNGGGLFARGNATVAISGGSVLSGNVAVNASGGGLAAGDNSTVNIENSTVTDNECDGYSGGGLVAYGNATVTISGGSVVSGNVVVNASGGGLAAYDNSTVNIENSTVTDNKSDGSSGGGLIAEGNATVTISGGSVVSANTAWNGEGGGLAAYGNTNVTMKNITCAHNVALYGRGGCIASGESSFVSIMQSVLANNTSEFSQGGGAASAEANARIIIDNGTVIVKNRAFGSNGGGFSVWDESSVLITGGSLVSDNMADLEGGGVYVVDNATVNVTGNATFTNNTSKYSGRDVRACGDGNLVLGDTNINKSSPTVFWSRTQCIPGETLLSGSCQACPAGTYNVDPLVKNCSPCPDNANCPGGDQISPKAGYWHSSKHSEQVHECLKNGSCLYGGVCSEGHIGKLCGSCDSGYGDTVPFQCEQCMPNWKATLLFLSGWVAMFLLVSWTVHTTLGDTASAGVGRPSDFLKVLVRHMQYLLVVASLPIPWPDALSAIFKAISWLFAASSGQAVSLSCLLGGTSSVLPLPMQKALLYLTAPLVMLVLVLTSRGLGRCLLGLRKGEQSCQHVKYSSWGEIVCSGLVVLFFFYPTVVRVGLGMFACIPLDSPGSSDIHAVANATYGYWVPDLEQACYEGWHKPWALGLGIPITLLFCLCVPVGIWVLLKVNKPKLYLQSFLAIGFLSHNYKSTRYYWEAVSTAQLAVVVAISVFMFNIGAYYATVLLNASYVLFFILQYMFQPAAVRNLQNMHMASFASLSFTTYIALTAFTVGQVEAPPLYNSIVGVFGLLVNVGFALWCCFEIVSAGYGVLKTLLQKVCAEGLGITMRRKRAGRGCAAPSEGCSAELGTEEMSADGGC